MATSNDSEKNTQHPEGKVLKRVGPAVRMIANGEPVWYLDFRYTDDKGKRKRFRQKADVQTQTAAVAEGDARKAKALRCGNPFGPLDVDGAPVDDAPKGPKPWAEKPLRDVVDIFLDNWAPANIAHSTRRRYQYFAKNRLVPMLGDIPIGKIDRALVAKWDAELVMKGANTEMRRNLHVILRSLLCRCAVEYGWLAEAPRMPALPSGSLHRPNVLTHEQVDAIIEATQGPAKRAFLLIAEAGLRPAEVLELRWGDVQIQKRVRDGKIVEKMVLRVRRGYVDGYVTSTKSGKERIVPVTNRLQEALGDPGAHDELVAPNRSGQRWYSHTLSRIFRRSVQAAKVLGKWRHYDLRHFYCTTLFRSNVNPRTVMSLMGHAGLNTTLRYAHVVEEDLFSAVEAAESFATQQARKSEAETQAEIKAHGEPMGLSAA